MPKAADCLRRPRIPRQHQPHRQAITGARAEPCACGPTAARPLICATSADSLAPLPIGDDGDGRTLNYGGTALGVGRNGDTLFVTGHDHKQLSCEITIPEPTLAPNDAPRAQYVQSFADAFAGRIEQINPGDPNAKKIGGHLSGATSCLCRLMRTTTVPVHRANHTSFGRSI